MTLHTPFHKLKKLILWQNVLKVWLVDNSITTDNKTDKIFQLETTRSIDKEIILNCMVAKNPGARREKWHWA